ncbi:MAG TPA: glycosyltransferase family 4 protein [Alphaproteobacteria bacterium]|nr:glycosyltransferase family 4 protein [Alphaproteobacteria bacterium]
MAGSRMARVTDDLKSQSSIVRRATPAGRPPASTRGAAPLAEGARVGQGAPAGRPVVLQVLPALGVGGAERGAVDVAAALVKAGGVAIVASAGGALERELARAGAIHVNLPLATKSPLAIRANIARLVSVIERYDVDIVHARSRAPAWSARAAARRTGAKFVTTYHGTYNEHGPLKRAYNSIMAQGDLVIAISQHIADLIVARYGTDPARIRLIHRGVDFEIFDPARVTPPRLIQLAQAWRLADGVPVVMLPGRLTRWKGQRVLIEALAKLGRGDLRCVLVGSDQGRTGYRRALERRIAALKLGSVVQLVGHCADMPAAYMLSDVVVSASTDPEAFGRVAVEAQAMGRLVIATDHGGARETVVAGETGWLVPPGDADALAKALQEALELAVDLGKRAQMAARAIQNVRAHFSKEAMCAATLAVYAELMAARDGDARASVARARAEKAAERA